MQPTEKIRKSKIFHVGVQKLFGEISRNATSSSPCTPLDSGDLFQSQVAKSSNRSFASGTLEVFLIWDFLKNDTNG
jgi:hypothetical protein